MPEFLPYPFNDPFQGTVDANGDLTIVFGPAYSNVWEVLQISLEMPDAPTGSSAEIRYMSSLVARAPSARKATASGDPPFFLKGGETMSVVWENCTVGDTGKVLVTYRKGVY